MKAKNKKKTPPLLSLCLWQGLLSLNATKAFPFGTLIKNGKKIIKEQSNSAEHPAILCTRHFAPQPPASAGVFLPVHKAEGGCGAALRLSLGMGRVRGWWWSW